MDKFLAESGFSLLQEYASALDAAKLNPAERVLDVATGSGRMALTLALKGFRVLSCDISPEALEKARARLTGINTRVELKLLNAEKLPFPDRQFASVTWANAIHEMHHPKAVLREITRVISPTGILLVIEFNPFGFDLMEQAHRRLDRSCHARGEMPPEEIERELKAGFKQVCRLPLSLNYAWIAAHKELPSG